MRVAVTLLIGLPKPALASSLLANLNSLVQANNLAQRHTPEVSIHGVP